MSLKQHSLFQTKPKISSKADLIADHLDKHGDKIIVELPLTSIESTPQVRKQFNQNKIQNLLSSLGFALRSFNNLNQFLELAPLMAARVTDADCSALILVNNSGYLSLEQLHCQDHQMNQEIREAISSVINKTNNKQINSILSTSLDEKISNVLGKKSCLYSTPILVKNVERGRIYIFSSDSEY